MSLLSTERTRALEERVHEVSREARATRRSLVLIHDERMDDAPSALELFAGAAHDGLARFFAARPEQGFELVALGCAARVAAWSAAGARRVRARCDALRERMRPVPSEDAAAPLWLGGMAFDAAEPRARHWSAYGAAHFVLPGLMLVRRAGETWLRFALEVDAQTRFDEALARWESWLEKRGPAALSIPSPRLEAERRAAEQYFSVVERGIAAVRDGALHKVVLACEERHAASVRSDVVLQALCAAHPSCVVFAQGIGDAVFVGATPELLVRRRGARVETSAVAATARRGGAALARRLQRSPKERREHALVVEDLAARLGPLCSELAVPERPVLLDTGTLQHLLTPIAGRLARSVHALDLVARLHPTPALGGAPREPALALIRALEGFDRGWYGGPIGWFDAHGDGEFHVALRCAWIGPEELRLYAGSGLVAESSPEDESRETAFKLASVREVLATR
jgi:salicylate biosynthesis isochorismate synthase